MTASKTPTPLVRLAHVWTFASYLESIGAAPDRSFGRYGLPRLCDDPDAYVPLRRVWSFFKHEGQREDPAIGWRAGEFAGDTGLNKGLLRRLENTPTLLRSLRALADLVSLEASDRTVGFRVRPADILYYTHCPGLQKADGYDIAQAYTLNVFINIVRLFLGPDWNPTAIGVENASAAPVIEQIYPESNIIPRQHSNYIVIPRSCLHAQPPARNFSGEEPMSADGPEKPDYVTTIRLLLKTYLADGYPSQDTAAELMNCSVRSLARRLSEHGLTYGQLVDDVRFDIARQYLHDTDMEISEIARLVGFSDQGNFTRMFNRVGGVTPAGFRRANQIETDRPAAH